MTKLSKFAACLLVVGLSGVTEAGPPLTVQQFPFDKLMLDEFLELVQKSGSALYAGPEVDCTLGKDCTVTIVPLEVFDGDTMLTCASQVGTVKIILGKHPIPGTVTKIHWVIGGVAHPHSPPSGATYSFKPPLALIVLRDDAKETAGKADSVTDTEIIMSHKYKPVPSSVVSDVVYYPLVWQKVPSSTEAALCGSGDPKIVNN